MPYLVVTLAVIISRVALGWMGVRFSFAFDWMWLSDQADLRDRLLETLFFTHSFPPGMNLLTGILLKVDSTRVVAMASWVFAALGLVTINSLLYVFRAAGLSTTVAAGLSLAFSLIPQSIYFENLYLYEMPSTALLLLSTALFHNAVKRQSFRAWFAFFSVCLAIGVTRSTFHFIWFCAMAGFGAWVSRPGARRVLLSALLPGLLLFGLYAKNYMMFGEFALDTFGPSNFHLATLRTLPVDVRDAWMAEGALSKFASTDVYSPPRAYLPFFGTSENRHWPPQLTRLEQPSSGAPNFNHWYFLDIHRARRVDVLHFLRRRTRDYVTNIFSALTDMFSPTTEWHPRSGTAQSPHDQHHQVLGAYVDTYNLTHRFPIAPVGPYLFLPPVWAWGVWRGCSWLRRNDADARARGALMFVCLFQIFYVVAASTMLTFFEESRYRYQIEAMIWVVTALCVQTLWQARPSWAGLKRATAAVGLASGGR
ncbi:MAG: hypothetical protein ABL961_14565 [Vicinamibacterales bacterium]